MRQGNTSIIDEELHHLCWWIMMIAECKRKLFKIKQLKQDQVQRTTPCIIYYSCFYQSLLILKKNEEETRISVLAKKVSKSFRKAWPMPLLDQIGNNRFVMKKSKFRKDELWSFESNRKKQGRDFYGRFLPPSSSSLWCSTTNSQINNQ